MNVWIAVALVGGVLSVAGVAFVVRERRRGRLSRGELLLHIVAFVMVVSIVVTTMLLGTSEDPSPGFAIFLPLWLALIVAARRRRQKKPATEKRQRQG